MTPHTALRKFDSALSRPSPLSRTSGPPTPGLAPVACSLSQMPAEVAEIAEPADAVPMSSPPKRSRSSTPRTATAAARVAPESAPKESVAAVARTPEPFARAASAPEQAHVAPPAALKLESAHHDTTRTPLKATWEAAVSAAQHRPAPASAAKPAARGPVAGTPSVKHMVSLFDAPASSPAVNAVKKPLRALELAKRALVRHIPL